MRVHFDLGLVEEELLEGLAVQSAEVGLEVFPLAHFLARVLHREHLRRAASIDAPPDRDFYLPFEESSEEVLTQFGEFCALMIEPLIRRRAVLGAALLDLCSALAESELETRARRRIAN